MPKHRVVIEISPTRLQVALVRGESIATTRTGRIQLTNYAETWPAVLDTVQTQLTAMVSEIGGAGADATVLYLSPTAGFGVFSCAQGAGAAKAAQAARLALADAAGFALPTNPHDLACLWTDQAAKDAGGPAPQSHTLGIADTDATAQAVAEWVKRAGLVPVALIPLDVPGAIACVEAALRRGTGPQVALSLFVGEYGSSLAAASHGCLRFIRQIAIGTESLVTAIARELRVGTEGRTVTLEPEAAARLIFASGIPERAQVFDAASGVTGDAILPLVQPILQRCVVDIKQSLRFGLEEKERETASLQGIGPGAHLPRLMNLISEQTGLAYAAPEQGSAESAGNVATWVNTRPVSIHLLPRGLRSQVIGRRVRRGLWVGVGVALGLVGVDAVMTRTDLSAETQNADKLRQRLEAAKPATSVQEKLVGIHSGLTIAHDHAAAKLGAIGTWDAALAMVASLTPANIKLTQIQCNFDSGKPVCRLTGHAPLTAQADSSAALKAYMDAFTKTPIVRSCRLGSTTRGEGAGGPVQNFDVTLVLVDLPAQPHVPDSTLTQAEDHP